MSEPTVARIFALRVKENQDGYPDQIMLVRATSAARAEACLKAQGLVLTEHVEDEPDDPRWAVDLDETTAV